MAGPWHGARLTKRLTLSGGMETIIKNHGAQVPPGTDDPDPDEDDHGDRDGVGYGSKAALLSILTAIRDRQRVPMPPPESLRGSADSVVWDEAAKHYGSFTAVRAVLDAIPDQGAARALRAEDVPDTVLPRADRVAKERARLAALRVGPPPKDGKPDNRPPARFILHGKDKAGRSYELPVTNLAEGRSADGTYLLAPGVWSVGTVATERLR